MISFNNGKSVQNLNLALSLFTTNCLSTRHSLPIAANGGQISSPAALASLGEILLVIILCRVPGSGREDLSHDLVRKLLLLFFHRSDMKWQREVGVNIFTRNYFMCEKVYPTENVDNVNVRVPFCNLVLTLVVVVDARSVLSTGVSSLSVQSGGVDEVPEDCQEVVIRDRSGVKSDLSSR